jgi:hypothetical protein
MAMRLLWSGGRGTQGGAARPCVDGLLCVMAPSHTLATLPIARTSINIGSNAHDTRPTLGIIDSNAHPSATSINIGSNARAPAGAPA